MAFIYKRHKITLSDAEKALGIEPVYDIGSMPIGVERLVKHFAKVGDKVVPCRTEELQPGQSTAYVHMSTHRGRVLDVFYKGDKGRLHHDTIDTTRKKLVERTITVDPDTGNTSITVEKDDIIRGQTLGYRLSGDSPVIKVVEGCAQVRRPVGELALLVSPATVMDPTAKNELGFVEHVLRAEATAGESADNFSITPAIAAAKAALSASAVVEP